MLDAASRLQTLFAKLISLGVSENPEFNAHDGKAELQFTPGQQVRAKVDAVLGNSSFKVSLANQAFQVSLPQATQVGETLDLVFVSNEPRPTFVLSNASPQSQAEVSTTGRYLSNLLPLTTKDPAIAVEGTRPILLSPPVSSASEFATQLQQAISQSGLFYESHQAQWLSGNFRLAQLLEEPQAKIGTNQTSVYLPEQKIGSAQSNPTAAHQSSSSLSQTTSLTKDSSSLVQSVTYDRSMLTANTENPIHPSTASLVQNQLYTLENQQIVWRGEIWPGQVLEWQIEERDSHNADQDPPSTWQSNLNLCLPKLGNISATLQLSRQGLQIQIRTQDNATLQSLKSNSSGLQKALADANVNLLGLTINPHVETQS